MPGEPDPSHEPHSAAYLDEQRDFWWNRDFLELVVARLGLAGARSVLDVGAGLGHWTRTLLSVLPSQASILGIERDPRWVTQANADATDLGLADRCRFVVGEAEALPFEDDRFDLVSCQTLLIHVADPAVVIGEMTRVLAPGGVILLSEPNNLAGLLIADSASASAPLEAVIERVAFALVCERGRAVLGEGDSAIADRLPGMLADAGLIDVRSMLNDRTFMLVPPYASADQRALRNVMLAASGDDRWIWSRADALRYFLAGGGDASEFADRWQRRLAEAVAAVRELAAGRLHTAGGAVHYLISARRPRA